MATANLETEVVDFHSHFLGGGLPLAALPKVPAAMRPAWERAYRQLASRDELDRSLESGRIGIRVISAPLEFVAGGDAEVVPPSLLRRINETVAAEAARWPDRLIGLATIDPFGGEAAAQELVHAVERLGLRGVFAESSRRGLLPNAPQARPFFEAADALGVPIFMHPIGDPTLRARFASCGRFSERLTRGAINAAAVLAMIDDGMFDRHSNLRLVVTSLAVGGLLGCGLARDAQASGNRVPRQLWVDTTSPSAASIRAALDLVGGDRVVVGTDWPVVESQDLPASLRGLLAEVGLDETRQRGIAAGNALSLLRPG